MCRPPGCRPMLLSVVSSDRRSQDTAKVLARFNSLLLARVFGHKDVLALAKHSSVPGTAFTQGHVNSLHILIWPHLQSSTRSRTFITRCKPWPTSSHCRQVHGSLWPHRWRHGSWRWGRSTSARCKAALWRGSATATTSYMTWRWAQHSSVGDVRSSP